MIKETVLMAKDRYDELMNKTDSKDKITKSISVQTEDSSENDVQDHASGFLQFKQEFTNGPPGVLNVTDNRRKNKRKRKTKNWIPY
jgi:hypothetical protein